MSHRKVPGESEPHESEPHEREPCCVDCMAELTAVKIDNSEYRDYFPTVDEMIEAVECLDAYREVFATPASMHAYLRTHGYPNHD